jgi:hypothetical protein
VKPCAVSPSAELIRDRRFSTATIAVSSTSCASSRWRRSASTIASVTLGGVAVIASAYSITSSSSSLKILLPRQFAVSRIFSSGTAWLTVVSQ